MGTIGLSHFQQGKERCYLREKEDNKLSFLRGHYSHFSQLSTRLEEVSTTCGSGWVRSHATAQITR